MHGAAYFLFSHAAPAGNSGYLRSLRGLAAGDPLSLKDISPYCCAFTAFVLFENLCPIVTSMDGKVKRFPGRSHDKRMNVFFN